MSHHRRHADSVLPEASLAFVSRAGDDLVTVKTPAFAESVTEGDVRWEKGGFEETLESFRCSGHVKGEFNTVCLCFSCGRLGD